MVEKNKLLDVTDLSMYLYCPRKFYLQKVKGIRGPPTNKMIEGKIRHEILENFSNKEQKLVESLTKEGKAKIISIYQQFLLKLINESFLKNRNQIFAFKISPQHLQEKVFTSMANDISLRADSIENAMNSGFLGKDLWENLKPKYLSEIPLISEKIGLKGRVDRIMFLEENIIPFELKTRAIEKVYDSDEIQLTAYAMLLEEKYNKEVNLGILESGNIKHEIIISNELKNKVLRLIQEIHSILDNPKFPSNFSKCQKCDLNEECDEL